VEYPARPFLTNLLRLNTKKLERKARRGLVKRKKKERRSKREKRRGVHRIAVDRFSHRESRASPYEPYREKNHRTEKKKGPKIVKRGESL